MWKLVELLSNPRAPLTLNEVARPVIGLGVEARLLLLQLAVGFHYFFMERRLAVRIPAGALHLIEPAAQPGGGEFGEVEVQLLVIQQLPIAAIRAPSRIGLDPIDAATGVYPGPDAPGRRTPPRSSGIEGRVNAGRHLPVLALPRRVDVEPAHRKLRRTGRRAPLKILANKPSLSRPLDEMLRVSDVSERQQGQEA